MPSETMAFNVDCPLFCWFDLRLVHHHSVEVNLEVFVCVIVHSYMYVCVHCVHTRECAHAHVLMSVITQNVHFIIYLILKLKQQLYFYFCLPLIPLWASPEEKDICLLHVGMPGQEECYTEIVSLWLRQSRSSRGVLLLCGCCCCIYVPAEVHPIRDNLQPLNLVLYICTLSWVVDWQSSEMSKPFEPLLLDMMGALC